MHLNSIRKQRKLFNSRLNVCPARKPHNKENRTKKRVFAKDLFHNDNGEFRSYEMFLLLIHLTMFYRYAADRKTY